MRCFIKNLGNKLAYLLLWIALVAGMHSIDNWLHPTPPDLNPANSIYSNLEQNDKTYGAPGAFGLNYEFLRTSPHALPQH